LSLCYEKFSPGFFDLIVFDEAHRSIFKRFAEVIEYFDARMIGLTATPANFIDRDTFRVFGCDTKIPTFLYEYPLAVKEKFLVDFSLYQAQTGFQRKGVKGADLTEEDRNTLCWFFLHLGHLPPFIIPADLKVYITEKFTEHGKVLVDEAKNKVANTEKLFRDWIAVNKLDYHELSLKFPPTSPSLNPKV